MPAPSVPVVSSGSVYRASASGTIDPVQEAAQWLEAEIRGETPSLLIVIGLAEGHLLDVLDRRSPATKVLAIEPDAVHARAFLNKAHRAGWVRSGRLTYLAGPAYDGAGDAWKLFPLSGDGFALLTHPRLTAHPDVARAAHTARDIVFGVKANAAARRRFAPRYLRNVIRNVPGLAAGRDAAALAGRYAGVPALITAAGPSLDCVMDDVRALGHRALLIAADTTLRPLLSAGIAPPLVVGADPGAANARHFRDLPPCGGTWLVAESALDHTAAAAFAGRTLWFRLANHHPWPWLRELGVDVCRMEMWGSVLTAAFELACLAGCDPIVIVGADLAFTGGRPYCRGTTYEFDWAYAVGTGQTLEEAWHAQMSRRTVTRALDLRGADTQTTASLLSFRDWMVARARKSGRRVVNATGAGVLHGDGIEQSTLADILRRDIRVPPIEQALGASAGAGAASVRAPLAAAARAAAAGAPWQQPVADWVEFSGADFDAGALEVAIAGALAVLAEPPADPHASVAGERMDASRIVGLAESTARLLRAGQAGALLPASARAGDVRPLVESLGLLRAICESACALDRLQPHGADAGGAPVSVAYLWPEQIRWNIQRFEAALGDACVRAMAPVTGSLTGGPGGAVQEARHPALASLELVLAWARCAATLAPVRDGDPAGPAGQREWSAVIERLYALAAPSGSSGREERLQIDLQARGAGLEESFRLPLVADADLLARALTGVFASGTSGSVAARLTAGAFEASVVLTYAESGRANPPGSSPALAGEGVVSRTRRHSIGVRSDVVGLIPRALTREGMPPAAACYATGRGVVCVPSHARESCIVDARGSVAPHLGWPRRIVGELPFGADGAVAWSNGMHDPAGAPGVVMYRRNASDPPVVEEIPFRPVFGAWWQGRLYLNCFPTQLDSWVGVASWAPGEEVRREIEGLTLFGLHAGHAQLRLDPCEFQPFVGYGRRTAQEGWTWDGQRLQALALGPEGAMSAQGAGNGWTVQAYPTANRLRFESADGRRLEMVCRSPRFLAWTGQSLIVSTVDREVLLFERLTGLLDGVREQAGDRLRERA